MWIKIQDPIMYPWLFFPNLGAYFLWNRLGHIAPLQENFPRINTFAFY